MACSESRTKRRDVPSSARALLEAESVAASSEQGMAAGVEEQKAMSARASRPAENLPPGRAHRAGRGRGLPPRAGARPRGTTDRAGLPSSGSAMDSSPRCWPGPGSPLPAQPRPPSRRAPAPNSPTNARSRPSLPHQRALSNCPTPPHPVRAPPPHQRSLQAQPARSRPGLLCFLGSFGSVRTRALASGAERAEDGRAAPRTGEAWRRRPRRPRGRCPAPRSA